MSIDIDVDNFNSSLIEKTYGIQSLVDQCPVGHNQCSKPYVLCWQVFSLFQPFQNSKKPAYVRYGSSIKVKISLAENLKMFTLFFYIGKDGYLNCQAKVYKSSISHGKLQNLFWKCSRISAYLNQCS